MNRFLDSKTIKLIIFDCDGTLVDSESVTMNLIITMMMEWGITLSYGAAMSRFVGKNMMAITDYMESRIGPFDKVAFEKEYRYRCISEFENKLKPITGVSDLIQALDVPICVASNGPREKMAITLQVTGLTSYFSNDRIYSAYDLNKWKPEPDLFLSAAEDMGFSPDDCLVIEDSITGIRAAQRAGMDVIAYNPHLDGEVQASGALQCTTMTEVFSYCESIGVIDRNVKNN